MNRDLILLQMRKIGYDSEQKLGLAHADLHFKLLTWLQNIYDHGCLDGNFHSNDITREIWDEFRKYHDPLYQMDNYAEVYELFGMIFSGDWEQCNGYREKE